MAQFMQKYLIRQSSIKVSEDNYPDCYKMLTEISKKMNITAPECYILSSEETNAYTFGLKVPYIVIYRKLFNEASKDELKAILSHELAHIKNKDYLVSIIDSLSLNFFTKWISKFFILLRKTDYRVAEVKADIEALKQTNLKTMKKLYLLLLGETDSSKVNFDKIIDDQYTNEKQNYFELFLDHPTLTHRYLMLKKVDELIKKGEKEIYVGSKKKHLLKIFLWIVILIASILFPFDFIIFDVIAFLGLIYNVKSYFSFKKKNKISL